MLMSALFIFFELSFILNSLSNHSDTNNHFSLPKKITESGPQQNQANYTSFERLSKNVLFIKIEPLCYGHLCQILAYFTMPTHKIRSNHATQIANFENFHLSLILH